MLPVGYDSKGDFLGSESWNDKSRHANTSSMYIMDRMKHNRVVGCTILRKSPSLLSSTSHGSRHSRPWKGLRKGQAMTRTTSKWTNEAFQGRIGQGGDLELQRGKMRGTNSAFLQRNFLFAGGIYRPASFFTLPCEWLGYACTLFPTCRWHLVYCTNCGGVSVLTNRRRGKPARGGPCHYIHKILTSFLFSYVHHD